MAEYTQDHARAGINAPLPKIECFRNQFKNYEITISIPEFTSVCPRPGCLILDDHHSIRPQPMVCRIEIAKDVYSRLSKPGIFYENAVNRILRDFVKASKPIKAIVTGEFNVRGGMKSVIEASYPAQSPSKNRKQ